jgi:hypothetical protein
VKPSKIINNITIYNNHEKFHNKLYEDLINKFKLLENNLYESNSKFIQDIKEKIHNTKNNLNLNLKNQKITEVNNNIDKHNNYINEYNKVLKDQEKLHNNVSYLNNMINTLKKDKNSDTTIIEKYTNDLNKNKSNEDKLLSRIDELNKIIKNYIISNNKYKFFIFNDNVLTKSTTNYDKSKKNNQWIITYDNFEKNYTINNKSNNTSILYTLGNKFKIKNYKVESDNEINNYVKIETNNNLKSTENVSDANIFSMYNAIESNNTNSNNIIFCDFKSDTYFLSKNLKNESGSTLISNYQKDDESNGVNRIMLIKTTGLLSNTYIIKYLQYCLLIYK